MSWAMTARIPRAVGMSIATVAVFDTKADNRQVMTPKAMITRYVDLATPGTESTAKASRRARPCLSIAWARINAPMKVKIVVDPKGARASAHSGSEKSSHPAGPTGHQSARKHASGPREDSWTSSSS
jgi:hypothetical protein